MRWSLPVLFAVIALATRVPILVAHLDTWYPFEVHSGTIAQALIDGIRLDVPKLPIIPHIRGGVVSGYLLVPIYSLLGTSAFAMKVLPVVWHAVTVGTAVSVVGRFFSRTASIAVGAILCAAPPMYTKLSVLGLSSHMESALPFLLALAFYLSMTLKRRFHYANVALFGIAVGVCGFFHLQALLPALVLLGALLVIEFRSLGWAKAGVLLLGILLGAAPSLAFVGGNFTLLTNSFNDNAASTDEAFRDASEVDEGGRMITAVTKLAGLATGDFPGALEFEEIPMIGRAASWIYSIALLITAGYALFRDRTDVMIRVRAAFSKDRSEVESPSTPLCGQTVVLAAHIAAVLLLFAVSYVQTRTLISSGAANRFLAPLLFSAFLLAGVGIGGLISDGRRRLGHAMLAAMVIPGILGLAATSSGSEASRMNQRGECLEWFGGYLQRETRGDPARLVALIDRVDRGDPRFQTLRFKAAFQRGQGPLNLAAENEYRGQLAPKDRLFAATWLGQRIAQQQGATTEPRLLISQFRQAAIQETLLGLPEVERLAVLHGVGLALDLPRGKDPKQHEAFYVSLGIAQEKLPEEVMTPILEGHGFRMGTVFNAYSDHMVAQVRRVGALAPEARKAFTRGLGWGLSQRYLEPPKRVPAGLVARAALTEDVLDVFDAAFTGTRLPREAIILSQSDKSERSGR